jgi:hypothetical protein
MNTMVANILSTLKALHYGGDRKNFTFDKYCTAHVDQHNSHAALAEYDVAPLEESMKIIDAAATSSKRFFLPH